MLRWARVRVARALDLAVGLGGSTPSVWRYVRAMWWGRVTCVINEIDRKRMDSVWRRRFRAEW